jgi:sugar lactone lactonase YvrE
VVALAVIATMLAVASAAGAYSTGSGYLASDYATGFPAGSYGPIGIAFDQSDNLYVADAVNGHIYRFQPGGGQAVQTNSIDVHPIPGGIEGLAITRDGHIYVARSHAGDVIEIDPGTGQVLREVVGGIAGATGLAVDPDGGDLFVSQNFSGNTIWRISGFATGPGKATAYVSNRHGVDGLAFDRSGTLYAAQEGQILEIGGTSSPMRGAVTQLADVPNADGVAFGVQDPSGGPPFLIVNRRDGIVTRVDRSGAQTSQTDIFTGGSRGDFSTVDSHGCLYITQQSSVVRISGSDNRCGSFAPTTPGRRPAPGVALTTRGFPTSRQACTRMQWLALRVAQRGDVRLRSASIYLNGRGVKQVRGRATTATVILSHLPSTSFVLKVVARTDRGKTLTTRRFYSNCQPPPRCSRLVVAVPAPPHVRIERVSAYVDGRTRRTVAHPRSRHLVLTRLPRGSYTVTLVVLTSKGRRQETTFYVGCRVPR